MATAAVNGVSYHYQILPAPATAPAKAPLVLLHGFTGSVDNWLPLQRMLQPTRTTIAIDLLGHGKSDAPTDPARYGMAASADDLRTLLAAVAPGPVDLLGYSMGGRLALYVALTQPTLVRRLILESASPGLADPAARAARVESDEALATRIERSGIAAFVERWEAIPLFASQRILPAATRVWLRNQRLQNRPRGLANSLRGMGTGVQPALWDRLSTLAVPTLLLTGALDTKFCAIAAEMATQLPIVEWQKVPAVGHTIHLEEPTAFQTAIRPFLDRDKADFEAQ